MEEANIMIIRTINRNITNNISSLLSNEESNPIPIFIVPSNTDPKTREYNYIYLKDTLYLIIE